MSFLAGFIHGMCDSKDLENNKRYILFLEEKQEGQDWYLQSGAAEDAYRDEDLVKMCNLTMEYPQGTYTCNNPTFQKSYEHGMYEDDETQLQTNTHKSKSVPLASWPY